MLTTIECQRQGLELLYTEQEIAERDRRLAEAVIRHYSTSQIREIVLVTVLTGAVDFAVSLEQYMEALSRQGQGLKMVRDYVRVERTRGDQFVAPRIVVDLFEDLKGRHVLIVEDIIDKGETVRFLLAEFSRRRPASLDVVARSMRSTSNFTNLNGEPLIGLPLMINDSRWAVGGGLDINGRGRGLRGIYLVAEGGK